MHCSQSIRVIKLYAWEEKFMQKITDARTMEVGGFSDNFTECGLDDLNDVYVDV